MSNVPPGPWVLSPEGWLLSLSYPSLGFEMFAAACPQSVPKQHPLSFWRLAGMLTSWGCLNNVRQIGRLKTTAVYCLTVLAAESGAEVLAGPCPL